MVEKMPLRCECILAYQFLICIEYILENTFLICIEYILENTYTVLVQGRRHKGKGYIT